MKNVISLQRYSFSWELEQEIARFVEYYNNESYHEALDIDTPVVHITAHIGRSSRGGNRSSGRL